MSRISDILDKLPESVGEPEEGWCVVDQHGDKLYAGPFFDKADAKGWKAHKGSSSYKIQFGKKSSSGDYFVQTRAVSESGNVDALLTKYKYVVKSGYIDDSHHPLTPSIEKEFKAVGYSFWYDSKKNKLKFTNDAEVAAKQDAEFKSNNALGGRSAGYRGLGQGGSSSGA